MIQLSQTKITTWQQCERKFQLRYIARQGWPEPPFALDLAAVMEQGEAFHMLAAQSYLMGDGFAFDPADLEEPVAGWWRNFIDNRPIPKKGQTARVEATLTANLTDKIKLVGRLDVLFLGKNKLEVFDWKTGKPRRESDLKADWQTRIYLALLYQSRQILGAPELAAEDVSITYWYPREPKKSVTIRYSEAWHAENWAELLKLAQQMEAKLERPDEVWPLTTHLATCGRCPFNAICGRKPEAEPESTGEEAIDSVPELSIHPDL